MMNGDLFYLRHSDVVTEEIDFFLKRFPEKHMKFFSKEKNCHKLAIRDIFLV